MEGGFRGLHRHGGRFLGCCLHFCGNRAPHCGAYKKFTSHEIHPVIPSSEYIWFTNLPLWNLFGMKIVGRPLRSPAVVPGDQAPHCCVGENSRDKHLPECGAIPGVCHTAWYLGDPYRHCHLLRQFELSQGKVWFSSTYIKYLAPLMSSSGGWIKWWQLHSRFPFLDHEIREAFFVVLVYTYMSEDWLMMMMMNRILRWLDDEAEKINEKDGGGLPIQFVILELSREFH